jgi:phenylpropionate dioxygenase-like ring-hydroxylating dioxygenase large terminal subunit
MACRIEQVAQPGDYQLFEIGLESILIVRGNDQVIRAFYNVCRHRNNLLVRGKRHGSAAVFGCSFHRWTWDNTGQVKHIPDRETFPGLPADCELALKVIRCETWGGFVFVCMDLQAPPLVEYLSPLPQTLERYRVADMALVRDYTVEWDCNWKVGVDAFNETYHVAATHPQLLSMIDDYNVRIECFERHSVFHVPYAVPSPRQSDRSALPKVLVDYANQQRGGASDGSASKSTGEESLPLIDAATFGGTVDDIRPAIQRAKRQRQAEMRHLPYANLSDSELTDNLHVMCFPNIQINVFAESALLFRHRPHPTDVNKSYYDVMFLAHRPDGERPPLPQHTFSRASETDLGLALNQDKDNVWSIQAGMRSRSTSGVYLSEQEARIRHFHKLLDDYMKCA